MLRTPFRFFPLLMTGMVLSAWPFTSTVWADDGHSADHERARAARDRGEALPLAGILTVIQRDFRGRVIDVELEQDDGRLFYELELLVPDGRVIKLKIDARTGSLVKIKGVRLETIFKQRTSEGASRP
jgi:hypothetical protein